MAHLVSFLGVLVHGALAIVAALIGVMAGVVEETTETGDADTTEDAEDVALVFVEFWEGVRV